VSASPQHETASSRLDGIRREQAFQVVVDGQMVEAYAGETVAAVLLAAGKRTFSYAPDGSPRGYACGVGRCFCCQVTIDGEAGVRACQTPARPEMKIRTGLGEGGRR
jgi:aerobic-type carbon monoxide dehydrogenase small subunit (CoxS/CutS family)